jgi:catechol-2,3-dioxygenase
MASPAKLAHVVLYSRQVPVMRDWYVNVLDAHVVYETPTLSFITYDNEHHRIAIGDPVAAQKMGEEALKVVGSTPTVAELSLEDLAALPRHGSPTSPLPTTRSRTCSGTGNGSTSSRFVRY